MLMVMMWIRVRVMVMAWVRVWVRVLYILACVIRVG